MTISTAYGAGASTVDNPLLSVLSILAHEPTNHYNFITVLAVAQKFKVRILPIIQQPIPSILYTGRTSSVHDSLVSVRGSFVLKHLNSDSKKEGDRAEIFKQIASEITILRHPEIQKHPNILDLEGLAWNFSAISPGLEDTPHRDSDDFAVWPVLVFEKSKFGDLYQFARSEAGRRLTTYERFRICLDIGAAIAFMQSHRKSPQEKTVSRGIEGTNYA
ncbi:hypothetical protein M426DRAFT_251200 [Hypoxylon sp. CI-4A]|nr:hypothetical protein M426DRAFT_251200 [Hypoxylon sp. CI-4A]